MKKNVRQKAENNTEKNYNMNCLKTTLGKIETNKLKKNLLGKTYDRNNIFIHNTKIL